MKAEIRQVLRCLESTRNFLVIYFYVEGKLHNIKVAMREIVLSPTKLANGKTEANAPVASLGAAVVPLHGALLSGCASHQLSADAYINN